MKVWDHNACKAEIKSLRQQLVTLKTELKSIGEAIDDPRTDLTMTMSEVIVEQKQQLAAALAEIAKIKEVEFPRKVEVVAASWMTKLAAQKEHSKEQFEKLLRWVDDYCEVSDTDFEQIEQVVQSVLGEALEATPLADLRQQLAAALAAIKVKDAFIEKIAKQTPEKPDYWTPCGQCEYNTYDAEDLLTIQPDDSALKEWLGEPVSWRYESATGVYRYRGYVENFDTDYKLLKPIPLYAPKGMK
ncbi:MAG: hypothetical protein IPG22_06560 [Acidobacteria bacterium]|nr:hypothetical protein [Acidobacteriota bacterium]